MSRRRPAYRIGAVLFVSLAVGTGCPDNRTPDGASAPAGPSNAGPGSPASAPAPPLAVDGKDDRAKPECFPDSRTVGDWVKTEPVRVLPPSRLTATFTPAEAARLAPFRLKSASTCAYTLDLPSKPITVQIAAVEAETPEDAYGCMTSQAVAVETVPVGGAARVDHEGGVRFHVWQGFFYIRLVSELDTDVEDRQIRRLLLSMVGRTPREDPPAMIEVAPAIDDQPKRCWLVRHPASLPPGSDVPVDVMNEADGIAAALGAGPKMLLCVAAYDVPQARRRNVVWMARYAVTEDAAAAYTRYDQYLSAAGHASSTSTNLMPPHGRFLIGTWTAEEESMQYLLPRIEGLLPK